ncbi:hypothetical protein [Streptomyces sp. KE1]|uniref:hypothetical protein n=1 Tax=Streptomyces sp. KE1 TaxID=1638939 RepID=UPI00063E9425|nr:hypothetical protein [Streptomyces sp. KE1]KLJ04546.1 hypothetical protein WQ59_03415 [Streptomyces sp. KE1]
MAEVWIGFNSADRLRLWWRNGLLTPALAGVLTATALTARGPDTWWLAGGLALLAVAHFAAMVNLTYGRVLLTAGGLEFRTFVSRRAIPWDEVAGIETRLRATRGGIWSDLLVVRVRGRSVAIPGTITNRLFDTELDRKQVAIQERWARAVGG